MMLVDAAKKSIFKQVMTVVTGTHNDTWRITSEQYKEQLGSFMRDALGFAGNLQVLKEQNDQKAESKKSEAYRRSQISKGRDP